MGEEESGMSDRDWCIFYEAVGLIFIACGRNKLWITIGYVTFTMSFVVGILFTK